MADNISSAAYAAKLAAEDLKKVEAYNKSLKAHKELTSLPPDLAQKQLSKYTPAQQASLKQQYGNEDPVKKPDEGWLSTAWNYTGGGSPILLTAIPDQIRGSAGTISTDATYAGTTSNRFDFGISNTSGSSQTIYYGYAKIS